MQPYDGVEANEHAAKCSTHSANPKLQSVRHPFWEEERLVAVHSMPNCLTRDTKDTRADDRYQPDAAGCVAAKAVARLNRSVQVPHDFRRAISLSSNSITWAA